MITRFELDIYEEMVVDYELRVKGRICEIEALVKDNDQKIHKYLSEMRATLDEYHTYAEAR